jgi:peptide chain release factor 1
LEFAFEVIVFQKLEEVEKKYEELTRQISDPSVVSDLSRYKKLAKERADLTKLVDTYRQYKKISTEIDGNRQIIEHEGDTELRQMAKDELTALEQKKTEFEKELKFLLLPKDPNDDKNILLEIRAGTGGEEAALFAAELFRMYSRYAERHGWKTEILDHSETGLGGFKEIIASISGDRVYSNLKYESGVHRVQRVPRTEASGRIHTSACTVAVLPEAEDIDIQIDEKDLRVDVFRASGPGGQGVNRTDSAVRLTHLPTGLVVQCQDERSQHKNKARALKILRSRLLDIGQQRQDAERTATRRQMVRSGDRSEKIRTYNYPQNRMTDHRIGLTIHNLPAILDGELDDMVSALRTHYQTEALASTSTDELLK